MSPNVLTCHSVTFSCLLVLRPSSWAVLWLVPRPPLVAACQLVCSPIYHYLALASVAKFVDLHICFPVRHLVVQRINDYFNLLLLFGCQCVNHRFALFLGKRVANFFFQHHRLPVSHRVYKLLGVHLRKCVA